MLRITMRDVDAQYIQMIYEDCRRIVEIAKKHGVSISVEYHQNTLTDTPKSARSLLGAVDGLYSYWQAFGDRTVEQQLSNINQLGSRLTNVHVHHLKDGKIEPLIEGKSCWLEYVRCLKQLPGERYLF